MSIASEESYTTMVLNYSNSSSDTSTTQFYINALVLICKYFYSISSFTGTRRADTILYVNAFLKCVIIDNGEVTISFGRSLQRRHLVTVYFTLKFSDARKDRGICVFRLLGNWTSCLY